MNEPKTNRKPNPVQIDFDEIAYEDEQHFANFQVSIFDVFLILGFTALFFVVFLQFFTRYVLNDSISWTEEAARYLLILMSFAGAVRCQLLGAHIVLEFMDRYYGRYQAFVKNFAAFLTAVLFAALGWGVWELIEKTSFQRMVSLPFPKYYLHALVLVFICANFLVALSQLIAGLRARYKD